MILKCERCRESWIFPTIFGLAAIYTWAPAFKKCVDRDIDRDIPLWLSRYREKFRAEREEILV